MPAPTQQTKCVLNGYTFLYNPITQMNNVYPSIAHTATMGGGYDTVWVDPNNSNVTYFRRDQVIDLTWPLMDAVFYAALQTIVQASASVTFVDWFGVSYTVLPLYLGFGTPLKGGTAAYQDVKCFLRVISQP